MRSEVRRDRPSRPAIAAAPRQASLTVATLADMIAGRARAERAIRNEDVFRRINERVHTLAEFDRESGPLERYVCECFQSTCAAVVELSSREYDAVRAVGSRFFILPDAVHVDPEWETVVARFDRYWVVEKEGEAGERAEELAEE